MYRTRTLPVPVPTRGKVPVYTRTQYSVGITVRSFAFKRSSPFKNTQAILASIHNVLLMVNLVISALLIQWIAGIKKTGFWALGTVS